MLGLSGKEFQGEPIKDAEGYMTEDQVLTLIENAKPVKPIDPDIFKFQVEVISDFCVCGFRLPRGFQAYLRLLWVTGARVNEVLGDHSGIRDASMNLSGSGT